MNVPEDPRLAWIFARRSVRAYGPGTVDDPHVMSLLAAAMAAPSAAAKDPWRFVVLRNPRQLANLAGGLPNGKMLATAPLGIVVCGDLEAAHDHELSYLIQDCSAAIENLLLAAHALGLGACWLGIHPRQKRIQHVSQLLGLPSHVLPVSAIAIGPPGETKAPRTRFNAAYVHDEGWVTPPAPSRASPRSP